ncbi:GNAT family N-acetyltransferase [bacterium]|nr:GNAT family N-acetyltransferase [bacterium]
MDVRVEGEWPNAVTLRRGWHRAEARPWNDSVPFAHLRLIRGGSAFLDDCAYALRGLGADGVLSPPVTDTARKMWEDAGFHFHAMLHLLRRELDDLPTPDHLVALGSPSDMREMLRIDGEAFDAFWRFDKRAIQEALTATPNAAIHIVRRPNNTLAGFSITGLGTAISYLQRVAVDPQWQGRGIGRSLIRTSALWARRNHAQAIVLNTQTENTAAIALYESEGYRVLREELAVLRK